MKDRWAAVFAPCADGTVMPRPSVLTADLFRRGEELEYDFRIRMIWRIRRQINAKAITVPITIPATAVSPKVDDGMYGS